MIAASKYTIIRPGKPPFLGTAQECADLLGVQRDWFYTLAGRGGHKDGKLVITKGNRKSGETRCWSCRRAIFGCSWSRDFRPVEGWRAIPTKLCGFGTKAETGIQSYLVLDCPEYEEG